ncbi:MAG TPA: sigma-54 factor interaction domain-containing protein [Planctomycetota bacterium]
MSLFSSAELELAEGLAAIVYTNPFLPERLVLERRLLGSEFVEVGPARAFTEGPEGRANTARLLLRGEPVLAAARARLAAGPGTPAELEVYEGLALFVLYHRWRDELGALLADVDEESAGPLRVPWYPRFREEALAALRPHGRRLPTDLEPAHLLALLFQVARAFHQIYVNLIGSSPAAIRLRAAVWQSIFTHDIRRYQRALYGRMADLATLVTGPSGTGKELVARAVARASYLPFDEPARSFALDLSALFLPLHLSALSPQLIESELFGYRKGAFTGALADRTGWFEACPAGGAVFLDEIGEIAPEIQVKLLRVLQTRRFQRLGDTRARDFRGKLISATNRDLAAELAAGRFRADLYYRLCSDHVETPSLAEQVRGDADELLRLVTFIARRQVGDEGEALARETLAWIESELGLDYPWPGNFRELEQCVRNVLVRKRYEPRPLARAAPLEDLVRRLRALEPTADELLRAYCTLVYAREGSFDGAARHLDLDRRTVRAKVDPELLERLARG